MRFFDLHCDTIGECFSSNKALFSNDLHLSLKRAGCFDFYTQVFAIWINDNLRKGPAVKYFENCADYYYKQLKINKDYMKKHNITPILAVEGGAALGGRIEELCSLSERGVKLMTLTWNGRNEIASGCSENEGGLTSFGKTVIKEMNRLNMTVDVSHLNKESFFDVTKFSEKPFIASHSNIDDPKVPYGKLRNLTKEQAKIIIERKGLIGINFYNKFLQRENESCFDAVYRRIYEICDIGGEKAVAFGSDFDGCEIEKPLNAIEKIPSLHRFLQRKGLNNEFLDRLFYKNASDYFKSL